MDLNYDQFNGDALIFKYNLDEYGNPISIKVDKEEKQVSVHGTIQLEYVPDEYNRVVMLNEDNAQMTEVFNRDEIKPNTYYIDYNNGVAYLDKSQFGKTKIYNYYKKGLQLIGCSRIYDEHDISGKHVVLTLQEIIDAGREALRFLLDIGDAKKVIELLESLIAEGKLTITNLENKKNECIQAIDNAISQATQDKNEIVQEIQDNIQQAKDEVVNVAGNKEVIIRASDWALNIDVYEKEISHNLNSENLHVTAKNSDTKEAVTIGYKILDKTRILLKSDEAINMSVILSASYYHATQTISDNIAEEVVKARKGETGLDVKIAKIDEQLVTNMNETLNVVRKVDGWTNLKSFKCDDGQWVQGDGIHDDTTGIQRAINSVSNNKVYGHGVFYITDTIYIPNRTWIDGDGGVTTTIFKTDKPINMFITEDKGLFVKLSNFRVKGVGGTTLSGLTVPSTNKSSFLTLEKVEFLNFTEHCLSIENMAGAKLYDVRCTCGGKYGLKAIGNNENNIIMNSWFTDSEINFYMEGGSTTKIYNSFFTTEEKGNEPNTRDTLYLLKLINTSMVKLYDCQFETIQDTLLSHVYIDRDNAKHHGTIESGVDNELYKCKWLSLNKKGDLITIGETSKIQGITAPSRTRITEPEFIQSINNYYDINIKNSIDTTIYRPIVKTNYWSPTNVEIKLNYDNINNFTLIPYKMIDGKETSDWRYIKLSDGTLIIRHKYRIDCTNTDVQVIAIPTSIPAFLNGSEKSCYFSIENIANKTARTEAKGISVGMTDTTSRHLQIVQDVQGTIRDLKLNITIIGRWK